MDSARPPALRVVRTTLPEATSLERSTVAAVPVFAQDILKVGAGAGGLLRSAQGIGAVATALVQTGTLRVGDVIVVGETFGPWGERAAQGVAIGAKSKELITTNASGVWARDGEDLLNAKRGTFIAARRPAHHCAISHAVSVAPGLGTIATRISSSSSR